MFEQTEQRLHSPEPIHVGAYILRPATMDDLDVVTALARLADIEVDGTSGLTPEQVAVEWNDPEFRLSESFRLAFEAATGKLVAYADFNIHPNLPVRPWTHGWVLPEHRGRGIGTTLIAWAIERALTEVPKAPPEARIVLNTGIYDQNQAAAGLLTDMGFQRMRASYVMMIDLNEAPPAPQWPEGITLTSLAETPDLARFMIASGEGFADHRGSIVSPFEERLARWQYSVDNDPLHDPTMWILAHDGEKSAGLMIAEKSPTYENTGWVSQLSVVPSYRRQGLALALLHDAFGRFRARGMKAVSLSVDGASLTNAVALYQRAGMHIHQQYDIYELELRPGVELTPQ